MENPSVRSDRGPERTFPLFWGCADRLGFWTSARRASVERWLARHGIQPRPIGAGRCCGQVAYNVGDTVRAARMARGFPSEPFAVASMSCALHLQRYGLPAEELTLFLLRRSWLPYVQHRENRPIRVLFFAGCHARSEAPHDVQELYQAVMERVPEVRWVFPDLPVCCGFAGVHSFLHAGHVVPVTLETMTLYGKVDRVVGVDPPCLERLGRWLRRPVEHVLSFLARREAQE